jgi:hypothetical protein
VHSWQDCYRRQRSPDPGSRSPSGACLAQRLVEAARKLPETLSLAEPPRESSPVFKPSSSYPIDPPGILARGRENCPFSPGGGSDTGSRNINGYRKWILQDFGNGYRGV